jgi:lysophospholipase L1-like esterase
VHELGNRYDPDPFLNPNHVPDSSREGEPMSVKISSLLLHTGTLLLAIGLSAIRANGADPPATAPSVQAADPLRMALPAEMFAVAGVESSIYFDNVVLALNPANYAFDVICLKGRQQSERWTWTPADADAGDVPFQLDVRDDQQRLVSSGRSVIKVIGRKPDPERTLSVLLIGDSLTHASVYSQQLLDLSVKSGTPKIGLVGSHGREPPGANRHEGYGGWTALRFATHYSDTARQGDYAKRGSPFLYRQPDGSTKLDFPHYCADVNEGKFPDAVTIFLGPNDIFSFNDQTIAGGIDSMLTHYDRLIEMVHSASPSTRIGVMLPVPAAASQDAFGSNYGTGQTRWQYKRNQHALVEAMIARYRDRDGVQLIATHVNLDCVNNYPTESVAPNSRSEQKVTRQSNGVHPSADGYRQIGDTVFAWLSSLP